MPRANTKRKKLSPIPEHKVAVSRKSMVKQLLYDGSRELDIDAPPGLRTVDSVPGRPHHEQSYIKAPKTGDELTVFFVTQLEKRVKDIASKLSAHEQRLARLEGNAKSGGRRRVTRKSQI